MLSYLTTDCNPQSESQVTSWVAHAVSYSNRIYLISAAQMIAIDTNVLVRLVVADDPAQARRARKLVEKNEVVVATTVLILSWGRSAASLIPMRAGIERTGPPAIRAA